METNGYEPIGAAIYDLASEAAALEDPFEDWEGAYAIDDCKIIPNVPNDVPQFLTNLEAHHIRRNILRREANRLHGYGITYL